MNKNIVLYLWTGCVYCNNLIKEMKENNLKPKITIKKYNDVFEVIEKHPELSGKGVPALIFYDDEGNVIGEEFDYNAILEKLKTF